MQIKLQLAPNKPLILPFNYNYQLQSSIYAKLSEINASGFWHDIGFGEKNRFKAFTFGPLKGSYYVEDNHIHFHDAVTLELRSPVFEFCDDFQRAIELNHKMKLFDTELSVVHADITNLHINSEVALFRSEMPITVYRNLENGKRQYFTPEDSDFYVGICNNFENKYEAIFNSTPEPIRIRPVGRYKKVVTRYKSTWIEAYQASLEVQGKSRNLEFLYNSGLGAKNSMGFGFIKLIR